MYDALIRFVQLDVVRDIWTVSKYVAPPGALVVLWLQTGKSPLMWLSWIALHGEAIRIGLWAAAKEAKYHLVDNYYRHISDVRAAAAQMQSGR